MKNGGTYVLLWSPGPRPSPVFRSAVCDCLSLNVSVSLFYFVCKRPGGVFRPALSMLASHSWRGSRVEVGTGSRVDTIWQLVKIALSTAVRLLFFLPRPDS